MLIVKKFGGSSLADKDKIFNVARRCASDWHKGNDVVVVLSAMGKTTDGLVEKALEISEKPPKREMDMLYAVGEQISVALMSMALFELNVPAISLNAFQVQIHTTNQYGDARITKIETDRIQHELDNKKIVIVTGFQGINKYDDYTTLGRGGSDTSAVALAATLNADRCEIFTDVDGVYTADPRLVPAAKKLEEITYDEMLELASLGAKVLHNRSVEIAKQYRIPLVVRSSFSDDEGTIVKERANTKDMLITGVAVDKNIARITVTGLPNEMGSAFRLCNVLAKKNINVDTILQSVDSSGDLSIAFTIKNNDFDETLKILEENKENAQIKNIEYDNNQTKLSIVGAGIMSHSGVASQMFESLYNAGININMISTSEIRISVLIDREYTERAVAAVHKSFSLEY